MGDSHRILILFAHPALHKSRVQAALIASAQQVTGIMVHDLYEEYHDFQIDVQREQELLNRHDLIIFQHPLYWYSSPAILKEWQDLVLEYGYAYGDGGTALHGKRMLSVLSAGGTEEAYGPQGYNRLPLRQLLVPFEQTAVLCGMEYLPPFVVHGARGLSREQIDGHAAEYRRFLEDLRDGSFDLQEALVKTRING